MTECTKGWRKVFKNSDFQLKMAKGLEKLIDTAKKAIATGLAGSMLLTAVPAKSWAETIYNKIHQVGFSFSDTKYRQGMPTTDLGVKVDLDKQEAGKYDLTLLLFTEDWNKRKQNKWDYVTITSLGTDLTIALPNEIEAGKIEQYVRVPKREKSTNGFASAGWGKIMGDGEYPAKKLKLKIVSEAGKSALGIVPAIISGGPVGVVAYIGTSILVKFGEDLTEYGIEKERIKRESNLEKFASNYHAESIPVLSVDDEVTARKLKITLEEAKKLNNGSAILYLNVGLKQGLSNSERKGQLERLLIEVPLKNEAENNILGSEKSGNNTADRYTHAVMNKNNRDNIRENYDAIILDKENNQATIRKTSISTRSNGWGNNWGFPDKYIYVKKKDATFRIEFSKIQSIDFLGDIRNEFGSMLGLKLKVSFWNGNVGEFEYPLINCSARFEGKADYTGLEGDYEIYFHKIKKIEFLREEQK